MTALNKTKHCALVCRFSTEDLSSSPEKKSKPTSSRHRNSADWLGLKADDDLVGGDRSEVKSPVENPRSASPPPVEERAPTADAAADDGSAVHGKPEVSRCQEKEEDEDDWLAGVLSRKKAQSKFDSESKSLEREEPSDPAEEVDAESNLR